MSSIDYGRVRQLYDAAIEKSVDERAAFLEAACSDAATRRGVESLLAIANRANSFLSQPAMLEGVDLLPIPEASRVFASGDVVDGRFEIEEHVASGGMGEVYRARDRKLDRRVALKVLPAHLSSRPDFRERLEREARATSSLNHPHICSLYDLGYDGSTGYLVMEYLEGETLRDRMAARRCTVAEMIGFAAETAEALEAAHARGIIHRDIKPANLFVTTRGQIKVMDFGLAKASREPRVPGSPEDSTMMIPGHDLSLTYPGSITGTIAYMSPEQARGEAIDIRTDLFSLGVVMHEMSTGRRPFLGDSSKVVREAILQRQPEKASKLNPELPTRTDQIISKALQKDRERRYQSAAELRNDLQALKQRVNGSTRKRRLAAALTVSALLIVAVLGVRWWTKPQSSVGREFITDRITTNSPEIPVDTARVSPDARWIAYSDRRGIHIRPTHREEDRTLPGTAGMYISAWGRDSRLIYASRLGNDNTEEGWAVPVNGDLPHRIGSGVPSPDGKYRVDFIEGEALIRTPDGRILCRFAGRESFRYIVDLDWSPTSNVAAAIWVSNTGDTTIELLTVSGCQRSTVASNDRAALSFAGVAWTSDARLLYAQRGHSAGQGSTIWAVDMNPATFKPEQPVLLASLRDALVSSISASRNGENIAFLRSEVQSDVYICELDKRGIPVSPPRRWTLDEKMDAPEAWSPDGKSLYFTSERNGLYHIFRRRLDADTAELVVSGPDGYSYTKVSPDGKWLLFASAPAGRDMRRATRILRMPISGGPAQEVLTLQGRLWTNSCALAPDGGCIVTEIRGKERVVSTYDPARGRGRVVLRVREESPGFNLSPDGRRIAMVLKNPSNTIRLYRLDGSVEREIAVREASRLHSANWTSDGRAFYCGHAVGGGRFEMLLVELDGTSRVIWKEGGMWAKPSPDGTHLALMANTRESNVWLL